jgi:hypothetical protein
MLARWSWFSSPATKKRAQEHEFSSRAIVLLLVCGVAVVFWQQLVGAAVFIGESDRLNTYLNMRLAEYDALQAYERVPAWNPTMFGGFSLAALHWMNPGTDPIALYLAALPPRSRVPSARIRLDRACARRLHHGVLLYSRSHRGENTRGYCGTLLRPIRVRDTPHRTGR